MENNTIRLQGTVEEIIFNNTTNGYVVLSLSTENDLITVVGELGEIKEGEKLIVDGNYSNHAKFGTQFKAVYCERKLPDTSDSIERYLASGIIKGIGNSVAKKIVQTFGEDTFNIIENQPERLAEIRGISKKKALAISKEFRHIFQLKSVVEYLLKFGIGSSVAMKVFRKWNFQALNKIKDNPYILCTDGINVPFKKAEEVAKACGIESDSSKRMFAGFEYVLEDANLEGHCCLPYDVFLKLAFKLLEIDVKKLERFLISALEQNIVLLYKDKSGEYYVCSNAYYMAEKYIATEVALMTELSKFKDTDFTTIIDALQERTNIIYGDKQREAINKSLNSNFMILTGGPGTGKTTTLNGIITILKSGGLKVQITAPTGRAAKRISEITGYNAMTIHRLLEVSFDDEGNQTFVHNEKNPLKCDAIIVDEMSMVDTLLFASLLKAVPLSAKVILVGDSDQLPSVSAGNVLNDLISTQLLDVITLDEIFRQAQESAIIVNAHKILSGEYPDILQKDKDFFFLQRLNYVEAQNTIVQLWKDRLPKAYKYNPLEDIQILSPSRKGVLGTINLNKILQEAFNPKKMGSRELKNAIYTFRIGDKVMQIKNNYDITWSKDGKSGVGIYNGDLGIVTDISSEGIEIDFDGREVIYETELIDQLELAYAITIHKSQGSEFNVVIMPMLNNFQKLCYRNLLYTGITRAKQLLIIVGSSKELFKMVDNDRQLLRYTCLKDMIICEFES